MRFVKVTDDPLPLIDDGLWFLVSKARQKRPEELHRLVEITYGNRNMVDGAANPIAVWLMASRPVCFGLVRVHRIPSANR